MLYDHTVKVYFDPQIFLLQRYGGISNYFQNLIGSFVKNPNLNVEPILSSSPKLNFHLISTLLNSTNEINKKDLSKIDIFKIINSRDIPHSDLIHFTYYLPSRFLFNNSMKSVSTIHDFIPEVLYSKFNPNRYMHYAKISYIKNSDGVIFVSDDSRTKFLQLYPSIHLPKNQIIHHGVTTYEEVISTKLKTGEPYFFYVGNRNKYKNFENLLRAFSKLPKSVQLFCFGGGAFTCHEKQLFQDLSLESVIHHVGSDTRNLNQLYSSSLAFQYNLRIRFENGREVTEIFTDPIAY
jgi:glycosyltransferase involved in cell wall biosynthesis